MSDDGVREINPVQWFDKRDAVTATKDYRPRAERVEEEEERTVPPPRKGPAKD